MLSIYFTYQQQIKPGRSRGDDTRQVYRPAGRRAAVLSPRNGRRLAPSQGRQRPPAERPPAERRPPRNGVSAKLRDGRGGAKLCFWGAARGAPRGAPLRWSHRPPLRWSHRPPLCWSRRPPLCWCSPSPACVCTSINKSTRKDADDC